MPNIFFLDLNDNIEEAEPNESEEKLNMLVNQTMGIDTKMQKLIDLLISEKK